jgi:hypothetical protein
MKRPRCDQTLLQGGMIPGVERGKPWEKEVLGQKMIRWLEQRKKIQGGIYTIKWILHTREVSGILV